MQLFHVEYFDLRNSAAAILALNNHKINGAVVHLSTHPSSNVVPGSKVTQEPEVADLGNSLNTIDLNGSSDEHAYMEGSPHHQTQDMPPTPTGLYDRARYGRRASTGSAFPSPGRLSDSSANQSTEHLPISELVTGMPASSGVPFPSYSDPLDSQELPQELRRRRSVAHSFDSASASSVSLSFKQLNKDMFPLSPDRTVSTAPSTPAGLGRKMSLPPFQGPLPPPASNQWTSAPAASPAEEEELDGFISVRTTAPGGSAPRSTLGAAHMCLPASARAVLDLLRDPPPERNRVDIARIEAGLDTRTTIMLKNVSDPLAAFSVPIKSNCVRTDPE